MASRAPRASGGDSPRSVAYRLLRAVDSDGAYANLVLPALIQRAGLNTRDAALATELGYGTLRSSGTLDEIIDRCLDRGLAGTRPGVRDLLRLGAYQALRTRIPPHAAVATTVELARGTGNARAAGLINAVLRRVCTADWPGWVQVLGEGGSPLRRLALGTAHPEWIAAAFADALGGDLAETAAALAADDERPRTHLVAWPGRVDRDALLADVAADVAAEAVAETGAEVGAEAGRYSPYAAILREGDPAKIAAVRAGNAAVQDEGSQLCALALARAAVSGRDRHWLDLCAGPGGKTALLAALAAERGASVVANELRPHRAELVRRATAAWEVAVHVGDARQFPSRPGGYDRVLVDAPCTGLGALRRRPEARWRRQAADVPELADLQRALLASALRLARPGGVVAYVTCSPHLAETAGVIAGYEVLDARPCFPGVEHLGSGPAVQLWPHRHGTDAMFFALLRA